MSLIRFIKTFNPRNNLKWNYEALALQIKVNSNKKRHPLTYSGCLKLRVCNNFMISQESTTKDVKLVGKNFTIDLNGRILLRSAVRTRQWAL